MVTPDDGTRDALVHVRALEDAGIQTLFEGQKITYQLLPDRKTGKTKAEKLHLI
ncbi:cold-shock protein [Labrys sp. 22185]|uniref:cold-shock protein n=1 Tax=Labrys sp. 22185 TaxID=3453888 RepID=UPI003F85F748